MVPTLMWSSQLCTDLCALSVKRLCLLARILLYGTIHSSMAPENVLSEYGVKTEVQNGCEGEQNVWSRSEGNKNVTVVRKFRERMVRF